MTIPEPKATAELPADQNESARENQAAVPKLATEERAHLRRCLADQFSISEMTALAFDLGLNSQDLPRATATELSVALIEHVERRGSINSLLREVVRQRYDPELAQLSAKLPGDVPYPKVQITLAPGVQVNRDELISDIAKKCQITPAQIHLINAAWSSLRLLISLPQTAAEKLLKSDIHSFVDGGYDVLAITAFDSLDKASQATWRRIAARNAPWPPVQWNEEALQGSSHGPSERLLDELRLDDAMTFLSWLSDEHLPPSMRELLLQANEKLRAREYQAAHDLCWQALIQVSSNSLSDLSHSAAGHCRVHLGAVYYARGDGYLDDAIEALSLASKELSCERRAQAVAEFILGAAYACKGERTKMHEHITHEVLNTLKWYPAAKQLDEKREEIRNRLTSNPIVHPTESSSPDDNKPKPLPPRPEPQRHERHIPSKEDASWLSRVLIAVALVAVVITGGILVFVLSRSLIGVLVYLIVLPSAALLWINRLKYKVEQDQALVVETGGAPKVCWGPHTYYRWPFSERFRAIVPLSPFQYTSPSRTVKLNPTKSVTIQLLVQYRVDSDGWKDSRVIESVYRPQLAARGSKKPQQPKRSSRPSMPDELQQIWEQRLLQDIIAALNRVLPGACYEKLAGEPMCDREEIQQRLQIDLAQRVCDWGMMIEEVGIADVSETK